MAETATVESPATNSVSRITQYDVFLSYAAEDAAWVGEVAARLTSLGLTPFDPFAVPSEFWGLNRNEVVIRTFPENCPAAFVVLSAAYSNSTESQIELRLLAEAASRSPASMLLPARLDDAPIPKPIRSYAVLDVRGIPPKKLAEELVGRILNRKGSNGTGRTAVATVTDYARLFNSDVKEEIAGVVRNAVADSFREQTAQSRQSPVGHDTKLFGPLLAPYDEWDESEKAKFNRLVSLLPELERELIHLRFYDGLSYEDLAERMNITESSVRVTLQQALAKLAQGLRRRSYHGPDAE